MALPPTALPPDLVEHARRLRRDATEAESALWDLLRDRRFGGLKFRRQGPLPPYVLDFFCVEKRLAIELDGGHHADPREVAADGARTAFLSERGIRVVRCWNHEVLRDLEAVVATLWAAVHPGE